MIFEQLRGVFLLGVKQSHTRNNNMTKDNDWNPNFVLANAMWPPRYVGQAPGDNRGTKEAYQATENCRRPVWQGDFVM